MTRFEAIEFGRAELKKHGLSDWSIKLSHDEKIQYYGLCVHNDKAILLNDFHIDIHGSKETKNTILHEIAHALVGPGYGHNDVWRTKAIEIGCDNTEPCSNLAIPPHVIDAIRSGAMVEVIVEEKIVQQTVRTVEHRITGLQDKCPECGKVAVYVSDKEYINEKGDTVIERTLECFHIVTKIIPRETPFHEIVTNSWESDCSHQFTKNRCDNCGEFRLFKFQVDGALACESALSMQKGFLIADDMGLGKTFQSLAVIKYHPELTPTMYVTKSALKYQWFVSINKILGPKYAAQILSTSRDFVIPNLKSYIIPYDLLRRFPAEKIAKLGIKCVVLDECQQIKNVDSARTQEVRKLVSNKECKVIGLSGTPWKNRGSEFFPILNMMDPYKFHSYQNYLDNWVDWYWEGNKKKMGGIKNPPKFKEYTKNLIIRREYNEVMEEYPDINKCKVPIELDLLQQASYDDSVSEFVAWYNEAVIGGEEDALNGIELLAKMARMRHITGLAKIPATLSFVEDFVEETERKLVIFVQHLDVGSLMLSALTDTNADSNPEWYHLAQSLVEQGIPVLKYGSQHTGKPVGAEIQNKFNTSSRVIMIASTLACGEGLDLQSCADCVMHERQWNPQNEDQAAPGRFRRIGQLAKVINITVPEAVTTIDEHLDSIIDRKRRQFHAIHGKGEAQTWSEGDIGRELAQLIVTKHQERMKGGNKPTKSITKAAQFKPTVVNLESAW